MELRHNVGASRYEAWEGDELAGEAHYTLTGREATFDHTLVPTRFEGRGVASRLVRYAMDDIRSAGEWHVRATCWYVDGWLQRHPEYADLTAAW